MNPVYLWAWKRNRLDAADPAILNQAFFRRMTPLQKAVVLCFLKLIDEEPAAIALARDTAAPLYLCSAFGEIGPMLRLTQAILARDLPVSPKDFQHSVLNAALSYLAIHQQWHQAGYALSGGFSGPDSTLHLAAQRLSSGLDRTCILAHGHEHPGSKEDGEAELLILSRDPPTHGGYRLDQSRWTRRETVSDARLYTEQADAVTVPWLIEGGEPVLRRFVSGRGNQGWMTVWTHNQSTVSSPIRGA